ncbi:MAG: HAD family phosphatase [Planctomycetes bacterium]|nr:HAD family phosphatase [Planctomycetota bacterium]
MPGLFAMEAIESVIFDWGGVLIDDPAPGLMQYCAQALAVSKEDYIKAHSKFAVDFEKNLINEDTFWERICGELGVSKPKVPSLWADAFKAAYVPRKDMFSLADRLRKNGYKTALLSNTEVAAMQYFHQLQYNMFDVLVFSCAEGARKPERKIYELTIQRLGSRPEQSVFIDDKPEYINGAKEAGLNTILFENIDQLKNALAKLGAQRRAVNKS